MPRNLAFENLLQEMAAIHQKKNQDYSSSGPYENFERSGEIASWFKSDIDKVFATLVGVKLARLGVLLSSNRKPNNESIQDSFLDLTVYCGLWGSYHRGYAGECSKEESHNESAGFYDKPSVPSPFKVDMITAAQKKRQEITALSAYLDDSQLAVLLSEARRLNRGTKDARSET